MKIKENAFLEYNKYLIVSNALYPICKENGKHSDFANQKYF